MSAASMNPPNFTNSVNRIGSGSPAVVHFQSRFVWPELACLVSQECIARPTDWRIEDTSNHTVIVHLGGEMTELATELEGRHGSIGPATPGEIWTVPAGRAYASYAKGGDIMFAVLSLPASSEVVVNRDLVHLAGHRDDSLHGRVRELIRHASVSDDVSQMEAESCAGRLAEWVANSYCPRRREFRRRTSPLGSQQARLVREYIGDNLSRRITLDDLAEVVGMTKNQLLIVFRNTFHITPAQYVIDQRLRRAQWLLLYTRLDITRIALESGFSSHSHLTSSFTRRYGRTPSQFRNNMSHPDEHLQALRD